MIEEFIKLAFVPGLREIVTRELSEKLDIEPVFASEYFAYLEPSVDLDAIEKLQSITNLFLVKRSEKIHPGYIANHKSILMNMIEQVLVRHPKDMKTYRISCAGDDSPEIKSLKHYIETQYKLSEDPEDPHLKINIGKSGDIWEISVEATPLPLSQRDYKVAHIKGGINPTVAYAINSLCDLPSRSSYLNPCSGSATLLIEAARINPHIKFIGFDHDKDHISRSIQNLRQAKLLKSVQIKFLDILDHPDLGTFDVIVSDLPFGMNIGKGEDLERLYQEFLKLCERSLAPNGILAIYTTEQNTLEPLLAKSSFETDRTIELQIMTNANAPIHPKIYICARPA